MADIQCAKCHKTISAAESVAFCPYCGEKIAPAAGGVDLSAVRNEDNPVKKHDMLLALQAQHPDSLEVAEELLYLGRLYERNHKSLDFSVIKSFVLNVYLDPGEMKPDKREALHREIFSHPDLDRCLLLAENKNAFLSRYLEHISEEFVRLFLKGSSQHMHTFFGFTQSSKAPKFLAQPAAVMLRNMQRDGSLTGEQRELLMRAFYTAFSCQADGQTKYLDEEMQRLGVSIKSE